MPPVRRSMRRTSRRTSRRTARRVNRRTAAVQPPAPAYSQPPPQPSPAYEQPPAQPSPAYEQPPAQPETSIIDQLERLGALRDSGVLTAEEFETQKRQILG
ncbi:MAG: SHOCT domain-containing protein [Actinomycetia bacterium]|nr:SHOCT domain-containing protein [Actinomycetes bacterium]